MKLKAICSVLLSFVLLAGGTSGCFTKQEFRPDEFTNAIVEAGGEGVTFDMKNSGYSIPHTYWFSMTAPEDLSRMGEILAVANKQLAEWRAGPNDPVYETIEFQLIFRMQGGPEITFSNQKLDEALYFEDDFCTMIVDNLNVWRPSSMLGSLREQAEEYLAPTLYMDIDGITDLRIGNVDLSKQFLEQINDEALEKSQIRSLRLRLPPEYDEQFAQHKESLAALPEPIELTVERVDIESQGFMTPTLYQDTLWSCEEYDISFQVDDERHAIGRATIDGETHYLYFIFASDDYERDYIYSNYIYMVHEISHPTIDAAMHDIRSSGESEVVLDGRVQPSNREFQITIASTSNFLWEQEERVITLTFTRSDLPAGSVNFHEETPASE